MCGNQENCDALSAITIYYLFIDYFPTNEHLIRPILLIIAIPKVFAREAKMKREIRNLLPYAILRFE
jgi:hypothetical protein